MGYKESNLVNCGGRDLVVTLPNIVVFNLVYIPRLTNFDYPFCGKTYYGGLPSVTKKINSLFKEHKLNAPAIESYCN